MQSEPRAAATTWRNCTRWAPSCRSTAHLADVSDALRALGRTFARHLAAAVGEPYRRAVTGIYARLAATARRALDCRNRPRRRSARRPPYADVGGVQGRSGHPAPLADSRTTRRMLARGRLRALAPGGGLCSASIWPVWTCGRTRTCMSGLWPSCSTPQRPGTGYLALGEDGADRRCLLPRTGQRAAL